jgi:hypothetical protein
VRRSHPEDIATLPLTSAPASLRAVDRLASVLAAAAVTDLDDPSWRVVQQDAVAATRDLVDADELPRHLAVASEDRPVVAVRTIAVAWRHVTADPRRSERAGRPGPMDGVRT